MATFSGQIANDGNSHTVVCSKANFADVSKTYNPATFTLSQKTDTNGLPYCCMGTACRAHTKNPLK
ncbi:MAG: hypothetical protein WCJ49_00605 [Deltaproteobacteria bacterium]